MSLRSAQAVFPAIAQEICQEEVSRPAGKDMMRRLDAKPSIYITRTNVAAKMYMKPTLTTCEVTICQVLL